MIKTAIILLAVCVCVYTGTVEHFQQEYDDIAPVEETIEQDELAVEGVQPNLDDGGKDIAEESLESCDKDCPYGMKYGSRQRHCYSFGQDNITWYDAVTVCELVTRTKDKTQNGWLAHLLDTVELDFFKTNTRDHRDYWIGGTDVLQYGDFQWYHWKAITNWFGSCKPPAKGYAQCTFIRDGRLYVDSCFERKGFICERRL